MGGWLEDSWGGWVVVLGVDGVGGWRVHGVVGVVKVGGWRVDGVGGCLVVWVVGGFMGWMVGWVVFVRCGGVGVGGSLYTYPLTHKKP